MSQLHTFGTIEEPPAALADPIGDGLVPGQGTAPEAEMVTSAPRSLTPLKIGGIAAVGVLIAGVLAFLFLSGSDEPDGTSLAPAVTGSPSVADPAAPSPTLLPGGSAAAAGRNPFAGGTGAAGGAGPGGSGGATAATGAPAITSTVTRQVTATVRVPVVSTVRVPVVTTVTRSATPATVKATPATVSYVSLQSWDADTRVGLAVVNSMSRQMGEGSVRGDIKLTKADPAKSDCALFKLVGAADSTAKSVCVGADAVRFG